LIALHVDLVTPSTSVCTQNIISNVRAMYSRILPTKRNVLVFPSDTGTTDHMYVLYSTAFRAHGLEIEIPLNTCHNSMYLLNRCVLFGMAIAVSDPHVDVFRNTQWRAPPQL
jgi:hypothetical protein